MFLLFVLVIFFCSFVFGKDGECYRTFRDEDLQKSVIEYYCCDDYERINGTCIECKKGYTSADGKQCRPCPANLYGIKCFRSCKCADNQRCHHVDGCIYLPTTATLTTTEDSSTAVSLITKIYETEKGDRSQGLFGQKMMFYTVCIAGLLVVIAICYVIAKRLSKTRNVNRQNEINSMNREHENERLNVFCRQLPNPVISNPENGAKFESFYDEIDEISIRETKAPFKRRVSKPYGSTSETSESENEDKLEDDGYLNPYQQIVNDNDSHSYNCAIIDSKKKSKGIPLKNRQEIEYSDAISSKYSSERQYLEIVDQQSLNCRNAYNDLQLHPFQTLQNSGVVDVLNYKKTGTSMFQLSSETNAFDEQRSGVHPFKKRLSI